MFKYAAAALLAVNVSALKLARDTTQQEKPTQETDDTTQQERPTCDPAVEECPERPEEHPDAPEGDDYYNNYYHDDHYEPRLPHWLYIEHDVRIDLDIEFPDASGACENPDFTATPYDSTLLLGVSYLVSDILGHLEYECPSLPEFDALQDRYNELHEQIAAIFEDNSLATEVGCFEDLPRDLFEANDFVLHAIDVYNEECLGWSLEQPDWLIIDEEGNISLDIESPDASGACSDEDAVIEFYTEPFVLDAIALLEDVKDARDSEECPVYEEFVELVQRAEQVRDEYYAIINGDVEHAELGCFHPEAGIDVDHIERFIEFSIDLYEEHCIPTQEFDDAVTIN